MHIIKIIIYEQKVYNYNKNELKIYLKNIK